MAFLLTDFKIPFRKDNSFTILQTQTLKKSLFICSPFRHASKMSRCLLSEHAECRPLDIKPMCISLSLENRGTCHYMIQAELNKPLNHAHRVATSE